MNDSKDFQDAESIRSGNSHDTSQPVSFPPHPIPGGMLSRSFGMASRREGPPSIWDTHLQIQLRHLQHVVLKNRIHGVPEKKSRFTHKHWKRMRNKHQFKIRDASLDSQPKVLSSLARETLKRIMEADQQRLQISDLHFDKFPTPATFSCWKIRFKTEVCTCSQFPSEAMQWIEEVEMVDSVDDV